MKSLISKNEKITIIELAEKIGVNERTIKRVLKILQNQNNLMRGFRKNKWGYFSRTLQ